MTGGPTFQLLDRVALSLSAFDVWEYDRFVPFARWRQHGVGSD